VFAFDNPADRPETLPINPVVRIEPVLRPAAAPVLVVAAIP
jgi:hypothetical protein